jgi:hypothetical protein
MMTKNELLNNLQQEQAHWQALLAQIGVAHMDEPGVADDWSIKDIVAHLTGWRKRTVARLQAEQQGVTTPPPPWPAHLQTDDEINAWIYAENRGRSVQEVLDDSEQTFQQMVRAIEALPAEGLLDPQRFAWTQGEALTAALLFAHFHEEHEPDIRAWLAQQKKTRM